MAHVCVGMKEKREHIINNVDVLGIYRRVRMRGHGSRWLKTVRAVLHSGSGHGGIWKARAVVGQVCQLDAKWEHNSRGS